MAIQEQTELSRPLARTRRAPVEPSPGVDDAAEWTATPLRPVARWNLVPQGDGAARLEMVWSVPDPRADLI